MRRLIILGMVLFEDAALWVAAIIAACGIKFWYDGNMAWWIAVPMILIFVGMLIRTLIIVFSGEIVCARIARINKEKLRHKECVIQYQAEDGRIVEVIQTLQGSKYKAGMEVAALVGKNPTNVRVV